MYLPVSAQVKEVKRDIAQLSSGGEVVLQENFFGSQFLRMAIIIYYSKETVKNK